MYGYYLDKRNDLGMEFECLEYLNGYVTNAGLDIQNKGFSGKKDVWLVDYESKTMKGKSSDLFGWKKTVSFDHLASNSRNQLLTGGFQSGPNTRSSQALVKPPTRNTIFSECLARHEHLMLSIRKIPLQESLIKIFEKAISRSSRRRTVWKCLF